MNYKFMFIVLFINTINSKQYELKETINLIQHNHVSLLGEINDDMDEELISDLFKQDNDFYLYIDSTGGDVETGLKIIKMMKYIQSDNIKIKCIANKAFSMAFHIFQKCDERLITDNSILMQHNVHTMLSGNIYDVEILLNKYIKISNEIIEYDSSKLKINLKNYKLYLKNEIWLKGNDIIIHNAADRKIILI